MDPVTAIGFAASILTFLDFSTSLVRGSYDVYKSSTGTTRENAHVCNLLADLRAVVADLETDFEGQSKHEKALIKLGQQCQSLAHELAYMLQKLTAKGDSSWESVKAKWRSMRKEKEVVYIEQRLNQYRSEIVLRVEMMIW